MTIYRPGDPGFAAAEARWLVSRKAVPADFNDAVAQLCDELSAFIGPVPPRRQPTAAELRAQHMKHRRTLLELRAAVGEIAI